MSKTRKLNWEIPVLPVILFYICLTFLLSSCEATTSCNLQAVAGGSQYCEQIEGK